MGWLSSQGSAPQTGCDSVPCNIETSFGYVGGSDTNDSSGSISHLVIAEAGRYDYAGMTLNSVGSATDIKYVQVSRSNRDGLVIAGGNANLRNIVLTTQGDHSLDISSGFSGSIQHLLIKQEDWNTGAAINYSIEDETAAASPM